MSYSDPEHDLKFAVLMEGVSILNSSMEVNSHSSKVISLCCASVKSLVKARLP